MDAAFSLLQACKLGMISLFVSDFMVIDAVVKLMVD